MHDQPPMPSDDLHTIEQGGRTGDRKFTYYPIDFEIGAGNTDYEKYLRTVELLSLQKDPAGDTTTSPEEQLFQITHQTSELWMKQMLYDLSRVRQFIQADQLSMAIRSMRLITDVQRILVGQVDLLGRHLSIQEYEKIRLGLGQGSGMESPGFNRLLHDSPHLWEAFEDLLNRKNMDLMTLYRHYEKHTELHTLAEYLVDYDDQFYKWRTHHIDLVRRTIGLHSHSLKGIPSKVLQKGVRERFFPKLFEIRDQMTNESAVAYGGQPLQ